MNTQNNISFRKVKMRKELQDKLYEKHPEIFCQKDLSMQQTAMCWGIDCGDGWYSIIDNLCSNIDSHIENKNWEIKHKKDRGELPQDAPNFPQVEATQVKEKYGGLRFYVNYYDEYISGMIHMAESMSYDICESCGNPGKPNEQGWISTLCDPCREEDRKRLERYEEQARQAAEARKNLTVEMKDVTVAP